MEYTILPEAIHVLLIHKPSTLKVVENNPLCPLPQKQASVSHNYCLSTVESFIDWG